ncbi:hypothetical protein [Aurantiacibacter sediminis]|uniref:DUF4175 domain-containing protein n=1 Tax=Aurantiacibacter sediminis TaxID=2793064 RepID=A0ABS0N1M0_9SPHN|nr:hypothetical protein [Aurantiacibacter sediminis]MBH5321205.1 hypothetical protein [Aurantiacibacter sediminis]
MLHSILSDDPWFEPKRLGYGSGLPCAWQGWVLLGVYLALMVGFGLMLEGDWLAVGAIGMAFSTVIFVLLAKRHTRGGWRWRS